MFEEIKQIVSQSNLNPEQQTELIQVLEKANSQELQDICYLLKQNPEIIDKLYQNYKAKMAAFSENDHEKWEQVLNDEEQLILDSEKNIP